MRWMKLQWGSVVLRWRKTAKGTTNHGFSQTARRGAMLICQTLEKFDDVLRLVAMRLKQNHLWFIVTFVKNGFMARKNVISVLTTFRSDEYLLNLVTDFSRCESITDNQSKGYEVWSCSSCCKKGEVSISKYLFYCTYTREYLWRINQRSLFNFRKQDNELSSPRLLRPSTTWEDSVWHKKISGRTTITLV